MAAPVCLRQGLVDVLHVEGVLSDEWQPGWLMVYADHVAVHTLQAAGGREQFRASSEPARVLLWANVDGVVPSAKRARCVKLTMQPGNAVLRFRLPSDETFEQWLACCLAAASQAAAAAGGDDEFRVARHRTHVQFYVNGREYFGALANALRSARHDVLISSWYLTPEIYLQRDGAGFDQNNRLDNLLQSRARDGVRIRVLLFRAPDLPSLQLRAEQTKAHLEALHANIRVIFHVASLASMRYCHHQKFVVVDRELAFVGGMDLAVGRFDDEQYAIADPLERTFPGADYHNSDIALPRNTDSLHLDVLDRTRHARLPWHDIQCSVDGECARDVALSFVQTWNHFRLSIVADSATGAGASNSGTGAGDGGSSGAAPTEVASNARHSAASYAPLFPTVYADELADASSADTDARLSAPPPGEHTISCVRTTCIRAHGHCQVVRSLGPWAGAPRADASLYHRLVQMILGARHYVYIENQFLISSTAAGVENQVGRALVQRVSEAIGRSEPFRVIIVLPIHAEGDPALSSTVRAVMHYQYATLARGPTSILGQLAARHPDACLADYVGIYSMRTHGRIGREAAMSRIYVHGKLTLVDDRAALVGSANINDRSLLGDRDTEMGIFVEDADLTVSRMAGAVYEAGPSVIQLRKRLWANLLDVDIGDPRLDDPLDRESYYALFVETAKNNLNRYQNCFPCTPTDAILSLEDLAEAARGPLNPGELRWVKGTICEFPLRFLAEEDLTPSFGEVDYLLDRKFFV